MRTLLICIGMVCSSAAIAVGQPVVDLSKVRPARPAVAQVRPIEVTGQLVGVKPHGVTVQLANNQTWEILIDSPQFSEQSKTEMKLVARGRTGVLQPGMATRFSVASIADGGNESLITQLTVFTPDAKTRFGEFSDDLSAGIDAQPAARGPQRPPANQDRKPPLPKPLGDYEILIEWESDTYSRPEESDSDPPTKVATPQTARRTVVGSIVRVRGSELTVSLPGKRAAYRLAPDAEVLVQLTDRATIARLMQVGDTVRVTGFYQAAGTAYAKRMEIQLDRELGADSPGNVFRPR
jgi:hypothetical protein